MRKGDFVFQVTFVNEFLFPDLQGTAEDFLLAGTDTTSITMSMVLYHVARNPEVQQKIVEEIDSLGENSEITSEVLNSE